MTANAHTLPASSTDAARLFTRVVVVVSSIDFATLRRAAEANERFHAVDAPPGQS